MKKVLHISKFYPPYKGGIEDVAYNIASALNSNYKQTVFCYNENENDDIDNIDNINIHRTGTIFSFYSQPISLKMFFNLKNILRDINPDIIHFHAPNPLIGIFLLFLINRHQKLIIHWHGDIESRIKAYTFYKPFEKSLLKRCQIIIITSPNYIALSSVLKSYERKVSVIQNIISVQKFDLIPKDLPIIEEIKNKYGDRIIFAFGRHVSYKGLEYLIKSEKYIKHNCSIIIAGSGPLTEKLKKQSNSSRIHFIGRISDDTLRQYLHASYLFAFPSVSRGEAFGLALAEAMYCRLPAVTFSIAGSGVNWVCPNNISGLEVENKNYIAYAQAIDQLLSNYNLRDNLANNAHERVINNFIFEKMQKEILNLYETL